VAARAARTPAKKDGDACAPRDLVVDATTSQDTYRGAQRPRFRTTVVNTGARTCAFRGGGLDISVTSGHDRIWSSADCTKNRGSSLERLRRGIPYVETVTWDRRRSAGGCRGRRLRVRPGTYVVAVKADGVKAKKRVFHLH
jgi:hypothetical protein